MKRTLYFFLLAVLLSSCATQPPGIRSRITIQLKDSTIGDYTLLSVRDSGLLVSSSAEPYHDPSSVRMISDASIAHVYRYGVKDDGNIFWGGVFGAVVGGFIGGIFTSHYNRFDPIAITLPVGILAGASVFGTFGVSDKTYDVHSHMARVSLRQYAQFPYGEPPELQQIK
jgi:hypothetical protein